MQLNWISISKYSHTLSPLTSQKITFSPLKLLYWIVRSTIQEYIHIYIYKNIYIYCIHCIVYIHRRLKLVCNVVSSSRLDAKDGGLALLKISACRLFQKVLYELVGELDKLEDTKAKHEAEDAAKAGKKLQEVHPWDAFVHLHLRYRCVSAYMSKETLWAKKTIFFPFIQK